MAELSEVLVLRLENYERQQKEITQLQAQIAKLQQRCQSVSWGVGIPPTCPGYGILASFSLPPSHAALPPARPNIPLCVGIRVGGDAREPLIVPTHCPRRGSRPSERLSQAT